METGELKLSFLSLLLYPSLFIYQDSLKTLNQSGWVLFLIYTPDETWSLGAHPPIGFYLRLHKSVSGNDEGAGEGSEDSRGKLTRMPTFGCRQVIASLLFTRAPTGWGRMVEGPPVMSPQQRAGMWQGTVRACLAAHPGRGHVRNTLGQEHPEAPGHQKPSRGPGELELSGGPGLAQRLGIQIQVGLDLHWWWYSGTETRKPEYTKTGLACWMRGRGEGLGG